jgi:hypothetical protein
MRRNLFKNGSLIYNGVKIIVWLFICWNGANALDASILCKHESLMDSLGNRIFVGCNNGQLKSIMLKQKEWPNAWIFIGMIKEVESGKYDFVLSETYTVFAGLREKALRDDFVEDDDVLILDTAFFQKGRTVFLRIYKQPKNTNLQLNRKLLTLNKNIKIAHLQKADIFTSDSIKIPDIIISRGSGLTSIDSINVKNFHVSLIDGEFFIQFDYVNRSWWDNRVENHQHKFKIP